MSLYCIFQSKCLGPGSAPQLVRALSRYIWAVGQGAQAGVNQ